jgi:antitoxin VapB
MSYHTSLNLESDEAYRLAKELAERTGKSMTAAVIEAMREQLARMKKESEAEFVERILTIGRAAAAEMTEEERTFDYDDMLYDERGLPRDC